MALPFRFDEIWANAISREYLERTRAYLRYPHLTDFLGCPLKLYLDRLYSALPAGSDLQSIKRGVLFHEAWKELAKHYPLFFKPENFEQAFIVEVRMKFVKPFRLIMHPDYYSRSLRKLTEFKTTRFPMHIVSRIIDGLEVGIQEGFQTAFSIPVFSEEDEKVGRRRIFPDWAIQTYAYYAFLTEISKEYDDPSLHPEEVTLMIHYNDGFLEHHLKSYEESEAGRWVYSVLEHKFRLRTRGIAYALEKFYEPAYGFTRRTHLLDPELANKLYRYSWEYWQEYISTFCTACPYFQMSLCPGVVRIKRGIYWHYEDALILYKLRKWVNNILPEELRKERAKTVAEILQTIRPWSAEEIAKRVFRPIRREVLRGGVRPF